MKDNLKKTHESLLSMYKRFKKICDENKIKYMGLFGTGIGACREGGFIPWDDDLDLGVFEEDMDLLIKKIKEDEYLEVQIGNEMQLRPFLKIYDNRFSISRYGGKTERYLFIDVFPLFKNEIKFKNKLAKINWTLLGFFSTVKQWSLSEIKGNEGFCIAVGYSIMKVILFPFTRSFFNWRILKKLRRITKCNEVCSKRQLLDSSIIDENKKRVVKTHVISFDTSKIIDHKFEDTTMPMNSTFREDSWETYKGDIMEKPENISHDHGVTFNEK